MFPYLFAASTAFFLPLTATRVYDTAFELSFTGVNKSTIQGALSLTSLLLLLLVCTIPKVRFKWLLPIAAAISILFQFVIAHQ